MAVDLDLEYNLDKKIEKTMDSNASDDVTVEVYIGKLSETGVICESQVKQMKLVQKNGDMYEYKAEIPMTNGGNYGFTYRIIPKNPMLINKQDMGLIKWVL